jgi:hypothetical protein
MVCVPLQNKTGIVWLALSPWWRSGLVCLPLDKKVAGSNPAKAMDFMGNKNPQHTFLRMGSKAGGPVS